MVHLDPTAATQWLGLLDAKSEGADLIPAAAATFQ